MDSGLAVLRQSGMTGPYFTIGGGGATARRCHGKLRDRHKPVVGDLLVQQGKRQ
jgi:hypothetical protein